MDAGSRQLSFISNLKGTLNYHAHFVYVFMVCVVGHILWYSHILQVSVNSGPWILPHGAYSKCMKSGIDFLSENNVIRIPAR